VNRRITVLVVVLVVAVSLAVHGAFSQASPPSNRKAINLPDDSPKAPFSAGRKWSSSSGLVNRAFGGWSLNTITLLETGPYLTPTINPRRSGGGR
jgi:hypothetical protein